MIARHTTNLILAAVLVALSNGCSRSIPNEAIVLTQIPLASVTATNGSAQRYPKGSRVVFAWAPFGPKDSQVLSVDLAAAGAPSVSWDATRVVFAAKPDAKSDWQIYESDLSNGTRRRLTDVPGGAMDPALLGNGDLLFCSPVPSAEPASRPPALFLRSQADGRIQQLTFATGPVSDPVALADGRILFVTTVPGSTPQAQRLGLFTINTDGTEFTPYGAFHEGALVIERPREIQSGLIGFLASDSMTAPRWAERIRSARPFASRQWLLNDSKAPCRSVEPGFNGSWMLSLKLDHAATEAKRTFGVYEATPGPMTKLLFDDPGFDDIEARPLIKGTRPKGHLSTMDAKKKTGTLLCLNANRSTIAASSAGTTATIRFTTRGPNGKSESVGTSVVQADGSFLAEVPADVPLGFETLDSRGNVIRRLDPFIWVRPGENRACVGCHEPHNRSPRNHRPIAVTAEAVKPAATSPRVAQAPVPR